MALELGPQDQLLDIPNSPKEDEQLTLWVLTSRIVRGIGGNEQSSYIFDDDWIREGPLHNIVNFL